MCVDGLVREFRFDEINNEWIELKNATNGVSQEYVDSELLNKVEKVAGLGLSAVNFTVAKDTKLNGLSNYAHPTNTGNKHIPSGGSANQILRWSSDGNASWGSDNNTTYGACSISTLGLTKKCEVQSNSVATTIEELVTDYNSLLSKLKTAGLM